MLSVDTLSCFESRLTIAAPGGRPEQEVALLPQGTATSASLRFSTLLDYGVLYCSRNQVRNSTIQVLNFQFWL